MLACMLVLCLWCCLLKNSDEPDIIFQLWKLHWLLSSPAKPKLIPCWCFLSTTVTLSRVNLRPALPLSSSLSKLTKEDLVVSCLVRTGHCLYGVRYHQFNITPLFFYLILQTVEDICFYLTVPVRWIHELFLLA